jgi:DNA mismatch repair ATPase MutS
LFDEVLRGTNTIERIAASSQVLLQFAGQNCICIAATHDIELTFILEESYRNVHFQETITNNEILFDYRVRDGRATSRNAIKLLQLMGFGAAIVEEAEKRADGFLNRGNWKENTGQES